MALDQITRLRNLIGEPIPVGGNEADTLFTDVQVQDFLDEGGRLTQAAYVGWLAKAGIYAGLVNTTEGNASRNMSDLHANALEMVRFYQGKIDLPVSGRTRIGTIRRYGGGQI